MDLVIAPPIIGAVSYEEVLSAVERFAADLAARSQAKLPSERELSTRLGASRSTVRRALADLERRGVVRRVRGRAGGAFLTGVDTRLRGPEGVVVSGGERKVQRSLNRVNSVPEMLSTQGFTTGTRVVAASLEHPSGPVAEFLGLEETDLVAAVLRVRFADGDSLSLERMYVSARRFPALIDCGLEGSMYGLFADRYGVTVGRVEEAIEAAAAPPQVAALLGLRDGDPLLKLTRRAFDAGDVPFEYSVDLFRSDRTRLTVQTTGPAARVRSTTASTTAEPARPSLTGDP